MIESISARNNDKDRKETKSQFVEYVKTGDQYMTESKWSDAADIYNKALAINSSNISILSKLGFSYSRNKQHELSINIFSDLSEREPRNAKWPYMIGYQYYDKKAWREAIHYFDLALAIDDNYIKVLYRAGYAKVQIGEVEEAEKLFIKCIKNCQAFDQQRKCAEKIRYSDACFQLGKLYLAKGLSIKAEKMFVDSLCKDERDEHKRYNLGKAFLKNGKLDEALKEFQIANNIHPKLDYFQDKLACTYLLMGKYSEADQIYKAIPHYKRKSYIWHNYGRVLLKLRIPDEAIKAFRKALNLDSRNHHFHFDLGCAYMEMEDMARALGEFDMAVKLKKNNYNSEYKEALEKINFIKSKYGELISINESSGSEKQLGSVEIFNSKRGYGFLKSINGEKIFFHINSVSNSKDICEGCHAEFVRVESDKGPKASKMSIL